MGEILDCFYEGVILSMAGSLVFFALCSPFYYSQKNFRKEGEEGWRKRLEKIKDLTLSVKELDSEMTIKDGIEFDQPIFYTGTFTVQIPAVDNEFGVMGMNSAILKRKVEVYCWRQNISYDLDDGSVANYSYK